MRVARIVVGTSLLFASVAAVHQVAKPRAPSRGAPVGDANAPLLATLRARFEAAPAGAPRAAPPSAAPRAAAFDAQAVFPLLPPAEVTGFSVDDETLRPQFPAGTAVHALSRLPARAGQRARVAAVDSEGGADFSLSFRVAGSEVGAPRDAALVDGYATYADVLPGATLLARASAEGIEDYVYFERAPTVPELRYDVELSSDVAGLRLVGNTLEALAADGTPRLRVSPPFLIDTARARVDATLDVEGCAADTDPSAPWDRPVTPPGASHCTVVVAWEADAVSYPAILDPTWGATGAMASARVYHSATTLTTGKVLVVGGIGSGGAPIATAELYNPAGAGTWAATDSVPTTGVGRAYHTAVALNDGTVFVAGGYRDATNSTTTTAIYTPATGHWTNKASLAHARGSHAATVLTTGEVVVTGGVTGSGSGVTTVPNVEVYRPTGTNANTWFAANSPAGAKRASHASVRMANGDVLIVGGRDGATTLSTAWSYQLSSNAWTARGALTEGRYAATATTLTSGKILVTGGALYGTSTVSATCDLYDPASNAWRPSADLIGARYAHTASLLSDGSVLVAGGLGAAGTALLTVERFKPTWETWSEAPSLATARGFAAAVVLPGTPGAVLNAGGVTKATSPAYLSSAERFTVTTSTVTATEYHDGTHALWGPVSDLPEVNGPTDPYRTSRWTELKGTLYAPALVAGRAYPVVIFLHGNHPSCGTGSNPHVDTDNTYSGTPQSMGGACAAGANEVRSDRGFAYVATELADKGFIVVSMDANMGLAGRDDGGTDDQSLIDTRARLVLKTLQHMNQWTSGARATPSGLPSLQGHLDLSRVGLVGHSRGGEAVRSALYLLRNDTSAAWASYMPSLTIRGVFEIGSTDESVHPDREDHSTPWALLMGTCDTNAYYMPPGNSYTGLEVFDRQLQNSSAFAAQYVVWGANHNFYNSEWQLSDVERTLTGGDSGLTCNPTPIYQPGGPGTGVTGSAKQRQTAVFAITHFMQGFVATTPDASQLAIFDPLTPAPPAVMVSRGYQDSYDRSVLEDFHRDNGTSAAGIPTIVAGNVTVLQHAQSEAVGNQVGAGDHPGLSIAAVIWTSASANNVFETDWQYPNSGWSFTGYGHFVFRLDRDPADPLSAPTDFSVKLVNGNGTLSSSVAISQYIKLSGAPYILGVKEGYDENGQSIGLPNDSKPYPFATVRIPFSAFAGATLSSLRGVRFVFDRSSSGTIFLNDVRATP